MPKNRQLNNPPKTRPERLEDHVEIQGQGKKEKLGPPEWAKKGKEKGKGKGKAKGKGKK